MQQRCFMHCRINYPIVRLFDRLQGGCFQQSFMDTCEPLIPSALRTTGFYNLYRHIAAPNSHSSGKSDGQARGHLHTHSTAADYLLWFPCCEGIGESMSQ